MSNVLNFKMLNLFIKKVAVNSKLCTPLQKLISGGFIFHNGCYFLRSLYGIQSHISESDFIDATGYECFINSIHIDDYVEIDLFEQAMLFADKLIELWKIQNNGLILTVILSETEFGFNIKFHTCRKNEQWINEDEMDKFEEAMILLNSCH